MKIDPFWPLLQTAQARRSSARPRWSLRIALFVLASGWVLPRLQTSVIAPLSTLPPLRPFVHHITSSSQLVLALIGVSQSTSLPQRTAASN